MLYLALMLRLVAVQSDADWLGTWDQWYLVVASAPRWKLGWLLENIVEFCQDLLDIVQCLLYTLPFCCYCTDLNPVRDRFLIA